MRFITLLLVAMLSTGCISSIVSSARVEHDLKVCGNASYVAQTNCKQPVKNFSLYSPGYINADPGDGYYWLPKVKVLVTVQRGKPQTPSLNLEQPFTAAAAPQKAEPSEKKKDGGTNGADNKKQGEKKSDGDMGPEGDKKIDGENTAVEKKPSEDKKSKDNKKLEEGEGSTEGGSASGQTGNSELPIDSLVCRVELERTVVLPDPEYLYRLIYDKSLWRDDNFSLKITPDGFLSEVGITTTDQTGAAALKVISFAEEVGKGAIAFGTNGASSLLPGLSGFNMLRADIPKAAETYEIRRHPFRISMLIDPVDPLDVNRLQSALDAEDCDIDIKVTDPSARLTYDIKRARDTSDDQEKSTDKNKPIDKDGKTSKAPGKTEETMGNVQSEENIEENKVDKTAEGLTVETKTAAEKSAARHGIGESKSEEIVEETLKQKVFNHRSRTNSYRERLLKDSDELSKALKASEKARDEIRTKDKTKQGSRALNGIAYRPLLPYTLNFTGNAATAVQDRDESEHVELRYTILVPNASPILSTDITRAPLVKTVTNLTFTKGMLTEVKFDKPSSMVAFFSLPVEAAKAIVAIPASLIQFKIDTTKKNEELLTAQKNFLTAKEELEKKIGEQQKVILEIQKDLLKAKTDLVTAQSDFVDAKDKLVKSQQTFEQRHDTRTLELQTAVTNAEAALVEAARKLYETRKAYEDLIKKIP